MSLISGTPGPERSGLGRNENHAALPGGSKNNRHEEQTKKLHQSVSLNADWKRAGSLFFLAAIHPPAVHKICPCWTNTQEDEPPRGETRIQMFYMRVFLMVGSSRGGVLSPQPLRLSAAPSPALRGDLQGEETLINGARKDPPVSRPEDLLKNLKWEF